MGTSKSKKEMEQRIKAMATDIASDEKAHITLDEAMREGWVIPRQDVEKMVKEELAKQEKILRADIEKEMKNKYEKVQCEVREKTVESYLNGTGLTSKQLGKRLIQMNVEKKYAKCLRDEHFKMKDKELWAYIRDTYKP